MMDVEHMVDQLTAAFRELGTAERAAGEKRYLKSSLEFFGVTLPTLRSTVVRALRAVPEPGHDELIALAAHLWRPPVHELRRAAVEVLILHRGALGPADLPMVEAMLRESGTWALVDELAACVAGSVVERHPELEPQLDRWAVDDDFWIRRAALLVHLLPLRSGGGDFARFCRYADRMLDEREFFIRKAIGWVLRESAKKRPREVAEWLIPRAARASGLTVREAVKHMPDELRKQVIDARHGGHERPPRGRPAT